ncbi:MAG: sugar kinase [Candidatus Diapherotrites archaeon]|uniref:Sugar kinase n=1 Tax=Candidatus Iainarchaeum sp. TaxID=3101447 RepID=A0A8T4L559_9ARCH|nr:sugar kinase [Candidatus Diapherotrites archaeon]
MPNLLSVGSIGIDSVSTPFGRANKVVGGSGSYSAIAASFFVPTALVSMVGKDFSKKHMEVFEKQGIDTSGIEVHPSKKTMVWRAHYGYDINDAKTDAIKLNAYADFVPTLSERHARIPFLFLANSDPEQQLSVLKQMARKPRLSVCDTMNFYIKKNPAKVREMVRSADIGLMNDAEARMLFKTTNLVKCAKEILKLNSKYAIIKKGENGVVLFSDNNSYFALPGYALENIKDPTGCGDAFAGAFLGFLAQSMNFDESNIRRALVTASAVASFNAEDFSFNRLLSLTQTEIRQRVREFRKIVLF